MQFEVGKDYIYEARGSSYNGMVISIQALDTSKPDYVTATITEGRFHYKAGDSVRMHIDAIAGWKPFQPTAASAHTPEPRKAVENAIEPCTCSGAELWARGCTCGHMKKVKLVSAYNKGESNGI